MIEICYIDGDKETVEPKLEEKNEHFPFVYDTDLESFKIFGLSNEQIVIPREFVKSIRYINV